MWVLDAATKSTHHISQSMLFWSVLPQFFVPAACGPACVPIGSFGSEIAVDVVADGFQFLLRVPPQCICVAEWKSKTIKPKFVAPENRIPHGTAGVTPATLPCVPVCKVQADRVRWVAGA